MLRTPGNLSVVRAVTVPNLEVSSQVLPFKGFPLTLHNSGGQLALGAVFETTGVSDITDNPPTMTWRGITQPVAVKGRSVIWPMSLDQRGSDEAMGNFMFHGTLLAVNENRSLIVADSGLDPDGWDDEAQMGWGGSLFTVRRYGRHWYIVVALF
jgi:hypothetical protein